MCTVKGFKELCSLLQPSSCQNQDFISEERLKNEEQQKKTQNNANLMQNLKITAFSFPLLFFLHFAFTCVVFLCTVPARGSVRGVYIPSKQACFCTYTAQPKATRFQTLLTHVYCHHQEVALLNSSTELNFSLLLKTSPWERQKQKNNKVSTSKNCAIFFQRGAHYFWECTKTKTKQDAGGSINTARYFSTTVSLLVFFICSFFI